MNSTENKTKKLPIISAQHFSQMTPESFHAHVKGMYELRQKGSKAAAKKPSSSVEGITLSRTKKGALSVRLTKKHRPFSYVLNAEINILAKENSLSIAETWNLFKAKEFLITNTRMEAEKIHAEIEGIPWK